MSATKDTPLGAISETCRLQFRVEAFNVFNRANFDLPGNVQTASSASFLFTDPSGRPNKASTRLVRTVSDARQLQFAVKLVW